MRIPKIYLETTIFNYNFEDDVPGKQQDNIKLLEDIENGLFEPYTSTIVVDELLKSRESQRSKML